MAHLTTQKDIVRLVQSGAILGSLLQKLAQKVRKGVNLLDCEQYAREFIKSNNAKPAFLGYTPEGADKAYPAALCTSLNDVVVHGTPKKYILKRGDVLKIDAGVVYEGIYSDAAITVIIGSSSRKTSHLLNATKQALYDAIDIAQKGNTIGDIGWAIEKRAHQEGMYVLKNLTGHGVGRELHEDPVIFNFGKRGTGEKLIPGMVLAIEPMFSMGSEHIIQNEDESYSSADGSLTAHFEHTILITDKGPRIITLPPEQ